MTARLSEADAVASMKAAGATPQVPYPGNSSIPWVCTCDRCRRVIRPRLGDVRGKGSNPCGFCSSTGGARIDHDEAIAQALKAGMMPDADCTSTSAPWPGTCLTCGAGVAPRLGAIRSGQGVCVPCGNARTSAALRLDIDGPELVHRYKAGESVLSIAALWDVSVSVVHRRLSELVQEGHIGRRGPLRRKVYTDGLNIGFRCPHCEEVKPVAKFHRNVGQSFSRANWCSACALKYRLATYKSDPIKYARMLEKARKQASDYAKRHPEKVRANEARRRARKRGAPTDDWTTSDLFALTEERDTWGCHWCGADITEGFHRDHVIPLARGGHDVIGNIVLACPPCNTSKNAKLPFTEWQPPLMTY